MARNIEASLESWGKETRLRNTRQLGFWSIAHDDERRQMTISMALDQTYKWVLIN
jgi:hypothetical protein